MCSLHWPPRLLSVYQPGDHVRRPTFSISLTRVLSFSVSSTPETFDIVSSTVDVSSRKNLAQISKVLAQVTSGSEFGDDSPSYIPINEYAEKAISQFTSWLFEGELFLRIYPTMHSLATVANVPDAETQCHAHEFLDVTVQPKPIYVSPNEVYAMHGLLAQHIDHLVRCSLYGPPGPLIHAILEPRA